MPFATVQEAAELYRRGEFVIIVDDEDRENEGDLCIAAERVTPETINFMAKFGRGLICLALTEERCKELDLPLMVENNTTNFGTAFTVSIEARGRVTTGISAPIARRPCAWRSIRRRGRTTSRGPGTCSRCARARAACSSAPGRPRPRSISRTIAGHDARRRSSARS